MTSTNNSQIANVDLTTATDADLVAVFTTERCVAEVAKGKGANVRIDTIAKRVAKRLGLVWPSAYCHFRAEERAIAMASRAVSKSPNVRISAGRTHHTCFQFVSDEMLASERAAEEAYRQSEARVRAATSAAYGIAGVSRENLKGYDRRNITLPVAVVEALVAAAQNDNSDAAAELAALKNKLAALLG